MQILDHLLFFSFLSRYYLFWRGKNFIRFMIFNTIVNLEKWRDTIWRNDDCSCVDYIVAIRWLEFVACCCIYFIVRLHFTFFFFLMDNGFKIGAETRIHDNVTIVNEKSSWIPNLWIISFCWNYFYEKISLQRLHALRRNVAFLIHTVI